MSLNWQQYHRYASSPTSSPASFASFFARHATCDLTFFFQNICVLSVKACLGRLFLLRVACSNKNPHFYQVACPFLAMVSKMFKTYVFYQSKRANAYILPAACTPREHSGRVRFACAPCTSGTDMWICCVRVTFSLRHIAYYSVFVNGYMVIRK
jgi:hypothetical protein